MHERILISLVSHQTIPNILLIKDQGAFDRYIFISTIDMEKPGASRSKWIIETCALSEGKCHVEQVKEDDIEDIRNKLTSLSFENRAKEIVVNITGGTKVMTLALFDYFSSNPQVVFLYKHIKNFTFLDLKKPLDGLKIKTQLTVKEYLSAYGIPITEKIPLKSEEYTNQFFRIYVDSRLDMEIIESLRLHYRGDKKKSHQISEIENFEEVVTSDTGKRIKELGEFLLNIGFPNEKTGELTKKEVDYLTGGWFEEYVYYQIKQFYPEKNICLGVTLLKGTQSNNNDLDVVFCINDTLFVIECKTSLKIDGKITQLLNDALYKSSALRQNFGLSARSFLFTLDDLGEKQIGDHKEKARVLGIGLAHRSDLVDTLKLMEVFPKI